MNPKILPWLVLCILSFSVCPAHAEWGEGWIERFDPLLISARKAYLAKRISRGDRDLSELWAIHAGTEAAPFAEFPPPEGPRIARPQHRDPVEELAWASDAPTVAEAIKRFEILYEEMYNSRHGMHESGDSIDWRFHLAVEYNLLRLYYMDGRPAMGDAWLRANWEPIRSPK
mgnify:CR=1 FL=1